MPRFMGFVRMEEDQGAPPQALMDAMDKYIGESAAAGRFLDGGGLYGTEDAVNFVVRKGEVTRVDGPYAEAKEVVGGWAILQYDTVEEAVADQEKFAELHATTVRDTVSFALAWERFDGQGEPKDPAANEAAARMLDQLTWWAATLRTGRATRAYAA